MYPEIEVRQLRCVIAVADELHFTRAAQKLHITQSALTRQIRHLELQLGVDLFIRGTRHVEPTDAGRALVEDGRKALVLMDRGVRRRLRRLRRLAACVLSLRRHPFLFATASLSRRSMAGVAD